MEKESKKALEQYCFIQNYVKEHGYAPSVGEVKNFMGHKSKSTTQYYMNKLFDAGLLETDIEINGVRPPRAYRLANPLKVDK